jgi:pre-rRNA-processing protein TSR4
MCFLSYCCYISDLENCANRYDRRATPLFFQSTDETYKYLHTVPAGTHVAVTGARDTLVTTSGAPKRPYNPRAEKLKPCAVCRRPTTTRSAGGERVFEFQLVPHLISVLQSSSDSKKSVDVKQRSKKTEAGNDGTEGPTAQERALEKTGMEWGTILIFTCRDNCSAGRVDDPTAKECWQEELVLVQWEE